MGGVGVVIRIRSMGGGKVWAMEVKCTYIYNAARVSTLNSDFILKGEVKPVTFGKEKEEVLQ